jgi:hypothetical protein
MTGRDTFARPGSSRNDSTGASPSSNRSEVGGSRDRVLVERSRATVGRMMQVVDTSAGVCHCHTPALEQQRDRTIRHGVRIERTVE